MQTIVVRTPAKLNLTFDILSRRSDGYHEIESIFQSINLEDELIVSADAAISNEFQIVCSDPEVQNLVPMDESNLIGKAAKTFLNRLPTRVNLKILVQLKKKIPVGAGLGGGSSNAAGMLVAMNEMLKQPFSHEELSVMAAEIGSDVPFCLAGGTCLGRGRGEVLQRIDSKLNLWFCIAKPRNLMVSTPWAYRSFDEYSGNVQKPCLNKALAGLSSANRDLTLAGLANVFEPLVFAEYPQLAELKDRLLAQGALACQMTGSGPTLFAVVTSKEAGERIVRALDADGCDGNRCGSDEAITRSATDFIEFHLAQSCAYGSRIVN
jgi:4-diphosphocytidyl-2-C-methyl-D-erythritol kinase